MGPRRRTSFALAALCASLTALALTAAPAFAATTHVFSTSFGSSGSGDGQLSSPQGVAVNSTSHDVYVADAGNARVDQFSSSGAFIRAFGAGVGGAGVNTCTSGCVAGTPGSGAGAFTIPTFIAVDNGALSPSHGDVYVADTGTNLVSKFSASGALISTWGSGGQLDGSAATGGPFTAITGITTDTSGNLFVYDPNALEWFEFAQDGSADPTVPLFRGTINVGIGVDGAGNFYKVVGNGNVEKFDSSGNDIGQVDAGSNDTGFAIDSSSTDIYVDQSGFIQHFDPSCNPSQSGPCPVTDSFGASHLISAGGLAVDSGSQTVYAVDGQHVDAFTGPVQVPDVNTSDATNVQPNSATLNGHADPAGGGDITNCHFEYVDDAHYQLSRYSTATTVACSPPTPISSATDVSADVSGLTAGTTYHFQLDSSNTNGQGQSQDQTQTDQALTTPPAVAGVSTDPATNIGPTTATLNGSLDPAGLDTTYHFQYTTSADFAAHGYANATTVPVPDADAGSTPGEAAVTPVDVTGLTPGTGYTFRIVAINSFGTTNGNDQTFPTPPPPSIDGGSAANLTASAADLNAKINPNGSDTTYHFSYGTDTSYGTDIPVSAADIGSGTSDVSVAQHITGLGPNTTYHWRVAATNPSGTTTGVDHTFIYDTTGAGLPDNRAYEMVSPPHKNGALIGATFGGVAAEFSEDGSRGILASVQCFAGAGSCNVSRGYTGTPYAFSRTSSGWAPTPLAPPATQFEENSNWIVSANAGTALFSMPNSPSGEEDDFYARRPDGSFFDIGPMGSKGYQSSNALGGQRVLATADLSHVVYAAFFALWPFDATTPGSTAYEYTGASNAAPALVGVSGGPASTDLISACGVQLGAFGSANPVGELSADGRTVYFTAYPCPSGTGANAGTPVPVRELFARIDGGEPGAHTVAISQPNALSPAPPNDACASETCQQNTSEKANFRDAKFEGASNDGSKVFFASPQQLTDAATEDGNSGDTGFACSQTTGQGGCNLYLYDFANPLGKSLIDVSAGDSSGLGPQVQGVMAISTDGSHVYFVARGVLTEAPNSQGQEAEAGADNLYAYQRDAAHPGGRLAFVAVLPESDSQEWSEDVGEPANVTPDGRFLVFTSHGRLTPDDASESAAAQVFRYDAQAEALTRISIGNNGFNDNGNAGTADANIAKPRYVIVGPARSDPTMSHDGARVFFMSPVGLTPRALNNVPIGTNGAGKPQYAQNVYEYEGGHVQLISDGRDAGTITGLLCDGTTSAVCLLGADASGDNVFFTSANQLVPQDTDTQLDVYDARVGGGFAEASGTTPCQTIEACHLGASQPPQLHTPGTATFNGPGNPKPTCEKGTVKRRGKCVKVRKHHRKRHHKRTGSNHGAQK